MRKVFGIVSYFPDNDTDYHMMVRKSRTVRCSALLTLLSDLWPDVDIIVIAQNWQDYEIPDIKNHIEILQCNKLGMRMARRMLRTAFLDSTYEYLIMLDDDVLFTCNDPVGYMRELDEHPDGICGISQVQPSMSFLAISQHLYSRIDIPDINPEDGEGYIEDVFCSRCMTKFPEKVFQLSKNYIDMQVSYLNKCPSTWMSESEYNWSYMAAATAAIANAATRIIPKSIDTDPCIDIIIPYVDSSDPAWVESYANAMGDLGYCLSRYRPWGTLRYLLRGVDKYMPFVRHVCLVVSDISQVPDWLELDTVRIITHREFIPEEYLPVFSSCTIECFLHRIKGLSEQIIYFNDDIFPINQLYLSDFFTNGLPNLTFQEHIPDHDDMIFKGQCRSSMNMIINMLGAESYVQGELLVPEHSALPMLRSSMWLVGGKCAADIADSISQKRESKNVNQYIYHYYQYFTKQYADRLCPYIYVETNDSIQCIKNSIMSREIPLVCLNDTYVTDYEYIKKQILTIFNEKFPDRSKFEKSNR